ncbi:MAG: hypothetical protein NDI94_04830 [Candidatus Woesearchaeota archaeon]|nr:hypothetical protein [Candidatus Woesearchaeota archaeon]
MKKAIIMSQLNWIYIAFVGGIIILSALTVIGKMKKSSEYNLVSDIKIYLDNILKNIQLSNKAEMDIKLPDVDVIFECDSFSIKGQQSSGLPISDNIIFSPRILRDKMFGYSLYWNMPFETEFFSYVTSPGVKYYFIDEPYPKKLFFTFPDIDKDLINFTDSNDEIKRDSGEKNYMIRIITTSAPTINKEVSAIKIEVITDKETFPDSFGKVTFFEEESEASSFFMDKATLFGAIYSQDQERYECNLKKAMQKLNVMSNIKRDKITEFKSTFLYCPYDEAIGYLNEMIKATAPLKTDQDSLMKIYVTAKKIKKENLLLQRLSCPMIY